MLKFWKLKNKSGNKFYLKRKVQIPVVKQMKIFPLKCISRIIFIFQNFNILNFYIFQKINYLGNFFKNVLRAVSAI